MDRFDEMRVKNISGGGGTVIIPPEAGNLIGIAVTKMPKKLDYNEGDSIDLTGLEVTAIYDNNVNGIVTSACTVTVNDPLTVYDKTVVVSYQEFETSFEIKVYGKSYEIPAGTRVLAHFNDNVINSINNTELNTTASAKYTSGKFGNALSNAFSITSPVANHNVPQPSEFVAGTATIEFWFNMKTQTSENGGLISHGYLSQSNGMLIWIGGSSIGIKFIYSNTRYDYEVFNSSYSDAYNKWHHYAFTFNNGTYSIFVDGKLLGRYTRTKTSGLWGNPSSLLINNDSAGIFDELVISDEVLYTDSFIPPTSPYGGEKVLQKIYIDTPPRKTIYQSGEYFDLSGAKIMAVFSNGNIVDVTSKCIIENDTPITTSDTFRKISYTYEDVTKTVYVNVGAYTVESSVDLSSAKLLMNFDMNTQDLTGINTPTIVGDDNYGVGQFGQARYFNGSTDYISMPYTTDINIDTGDFTIAFWLKNINTQDTSHVLNIEKWVTSSTVCGLRISVTKAGAVFVAFTSELPSTGLNLHLSNTTISNNVWHHLAIVRKGDTITLYIDGTKMNSVNHTGQLYFGNKLIIGARSIYNSTSYNYYLNGYIDDLIIAKSALWEGEFTPPTNPFSSIS